MRSVLPLCFEKQCVFQQRLYGDLSMLCVVAQKLVVARRHDAAEVLADTSPLIVSRPPNPIAVALTQ